MNGLGYSCATIPAIAHAPAACSEGNDVPALPELSCARGLEGTLTASGVFDRLDSNQSVNGRFPAEKAGLPLVLVVRYETEDVQSRRSCSHGVRAVIGNMTVPIEGVGNVREMAADIAVGREQRSCKSTKRDEPSGIGEADLSRACPHPNLIVKECPWQSNDFVLGLAGLGRIRNGILLRSWLLRIAIFGRRIRTRGAIRQGCR